MAEIMYPYPCIQQNYLFNIRVRKSYRNVTEHNDRRIIIIIINYVFLLVEI